MFLASLLFSVFTIATLWASAPRVQIIPVAKYISPRLSQVKHNLISQHLESLDLNFVWTLESPGRIYKALRICQQSRSPLFKVFFRSHIRCICISEMKDAVRV